MRGRDRHRFVAGPRAARHDQPAPAADVFDPDGQCAHHARRHLLRRAIRRQRQRDHDENPACEQHRRLHRRLPDDAQRQDRPRAVHGGRLELHRRNGRDRRSRLSRADARPGRAPVRPRRLLRADVARLHVREHCHDRQPRQRPGDVPDRRAPRPDRHRRGDGCPAFHVQHSCADRRRQPGERRARLFRHCRDCQEPRCARGTHTVQRQDTSDADLGRVQAHHSERVARQRGRLAPRHSARRRPDDRAVRCLCRRQEGQQVQRRDRLRLHRGRCRTGRRRRGRRAHELHSIDESGHP